MRARLVIATLAALVASSLVVVVSVRWRGSTDLPAVGTARDAPSSLEHRPAPPRAAPEAPDAPVEQTGGDFRPGDLYAVPSVLGAWARDLSEEEAQALAAVADGPRSRVSGTIGHQDGRGVGGIKVVARQERQLRMNPERVEDGESPLLPFAAFEDVARTVTDEQGQYAFEVPRARTIVRLDPVLEYEARAPADRSAVPPADNVDLTVVARWAIPLRITDASTGATVVDAWTTALTPKRTDDGWLLYLAPGEHTFRVYAENHVARRVSLTIPAGAPNPQPLIVELTPATTIPSS